MKLSKMSQTLGVDNLFLATALLLSSRDLQEDGRRRHYRRPARGGTRSLRGGRHPSESAGCAFRHDPGQKPFRTVQGTLDLATHEVGLQPDVLTNIPGNHALADGCRCNAGAAVVHRIEELGQRSAGETAVNDLGGDAQGRLPLHDRRRALRPEGPGGQELADEAYPEVALIPRGAHPGVAHALDRWQRTPAPGGEVATCLLDAGLRGRVTALGIPFARKATGHGIGRGLPETVGAIERWYRNDWTALDVNLSTSIVEGISVFLSLFDQPGVASLFWPPPPRPDEHIHM